MMNVKTYILILMLVFIGISAQGQSQRGKRPIDRTIKYKDYSNIIGLYGDINPDEIAVQLRVLGQASLHKGDYEKASNFFRRSILLDEGKVQESDIRDYYYSLLKSQQVDAVLNDSLGSHLAGRSKVVKQLIDNAKSREFYQKLEVPGITVKDMGLEGVLLRYGFTFNEYYIYFAYQKDIKGDEELLENSIYVDRVARRSNIMRARYLPTGEVGSEGSENYKMKDKRRIVTLSKSLKHNADFYTVVPDDGTPEQIEIKGGDFPPFPFNSTEYACAMPFFDEKSKRLYFSSTMIGGIGGWDIYYSSYNGARWNTPINMGNTVNSPFDELFPFMSDSLLYFSSDGWEGYGGFDNYVFNNEADSRLNIVIANGPEDDYCFQVVDQKSFQAVGIKGQKPVSISSDKSYKDLLSAMRIVVEGKYPEIPQELTQNLSINEFAYPDEQRVERIGYSNSAVVKEMSNESYPTAESDLFIKATGERAKQFNPVYFDMNSQEIERNYFPLLDDVVSQINDNKVKNIVVWGHADKSGTGRYNDHISYMRASAVVDYMKSRTVYDDDHEFFIIVAGAEYAEGASIGNRNDRKVVIREGLRYLPYPVMYAYKALPEQSLASVANLFGNDLGMLKQMNEITSMPANRLLLVGIQGIHLIAPGENLYRISLRYNCSVSAIQQLNRKNDNSVYAGEKLFIPLPATK